MLGENVFLPSPFSAVCSSSTFLPSHVLSPPLLMSYMIRRPPRRAWRRQHFWMRLYKQPVNSHGPGGGVLPDTKYVKLVHAVDVGFGFDGTLGTRQFDQQFTMNRLPLDPNADNDYNRVTDGFSTGLLDVATNGSWYVANGMYKYPTSWTRSIMPYSRFQITGFKATLVINPRFNPQINADLAGTGLSYPIYRTAIGMIFDQSLSTTPWSNAHALSGIVPSHRDWHAYMQSAWGEVPIDPIKPLRISRYFSMGKYFAQSKNQYETSAVNPSGVYAGQFAYFSSTGATNNGTISSSTSPSSAAVFHLAVETFGNNFNGSDLDSYTTPIGITGRMYLKYYVRLMGPLGTSTVINP